MHLGWLGSTGAQLSTHAFGEIDELLLCRIRGHALDLVPRLPLGFLLHVGKPWTFESDVSLCRLLVVSVGIHPLLVRQLALVGALHLLLRGLEVGLEIQVDEPAVLGHDLVRSLRLGANMSSLATRRSTPGLS